MTCQNRFPCWVWDQIISGDTTGSLVHNRCFTNKDTSSISSSWIVSGTQTDITKGFWRKWRHVVAVTVLTLVSENRHSSLKQHNFPHIFAIFVALNNREYLLSWELTYPFPAGTIEDFTFAQVVTCREGNSLDWNLWGPSLCVKTSSSS